MFSTDLSRTLRFIFWVVALSSALVGCGLRGPLVLPPGPPPEPILGWPGGKRPAIPLADPNGTPVEQVAPRQDTSGDATTPGITFTQ